MGEAVDADEDGVLLFDAGLHAGALEMRENQVLEIAEFLVLRPLGQFLRGNRLVTLERFHRERPGHAQPLFVFQRLVVKRLFRRRLVVGDAAERDVRHFLVNESLPEVALGSTRAACGFPRPRGKRFGGWTRSGAVGGGADRSTRGACAPQHVALSFLGIVEEVIRERGGHQTRLGDVQGDARGVGRNPTASPLLGHVSGRA